MDFGVIAGYWRIKKYKISGWSSLVEWVLWASLKESYFWPSSTKIVHQCSKTSVVELPSSDEPQQWFQYRSDPNAHIRSTVICPPITHNTICSPITIHTHGKVLVYKNSYHPTNSVKALKAIYGISKCTRDISNTKLIACTKNWITVVKVYQWSRCFWNTV